MATATKREQRAFLEAMKKKFSEDHSAKSHEDCPYCNGTGQKKWGKLGVRACVKCKGTGKVK